MEKTSLQKVGSCWGLGGGFLRQAKIRKKHNTPRSAPPKNPDVFFLGGFDDS